MNILILTGNFGMGHTSVANAIKQDIEQNNDNCNVKVIDIMEYSFPKIHKKIYKGFNVIAEKYHNIYNMAYDNVSGVGDFSTNMLFMKKVKNLIDYENPDVIISTISISSKLISSYKEKYDTKIPLVTCITDISSANEWIYDKTDMYVVATPSVENELSNKGIDDENILVTGIPVRKQFIINSVNKEKCLDSNKKNLLIMGGGLGLLPKDLEFYDKINELPNIKTTIITGNNIKLFNSLRNKYENMDVIGFTNKVYDYMHNADLIFSKAGGITLFESIQSELPMLVPRPFLRQERNNAKFIEANNIGKVLWNDDDTISVLTDLLEDEAEYKQRKENIKSIKKSLVDNPTKYIFDGLDLKEIIQC